LGGEDLSSEISSVRNPVQRIRQTSLGLLLLQSTTCSCTGIEPWSRWPRGAAFWADREAKVQIAPSGIMKKRKDGLVISLTPLSALVLDLASMGLTGQFFRVMSRLSHLFRRLRCLAPDLP
jgi:hypothetical protein